MPNNENRARNWGINTAEKLNISEIRIVETAIVERNFNDIDRIKLISKVTSS